MKKVLYTSQIAEVASSLDAAVIRYINEGQIQTFESFPRFDIIAFDWYDVFDSGAGPSQLLIYLDHEDVFVFCANQRSYDKAVSIFSPAETNAHTLYHFLSALLRGDAGCIEQLEDRVTETENAVLTGHYRNCTGDIIRYRQELMRLKRYYEQLNAILEQLEENDNGVIPADELGRFVILGSRTQRLLASVGNLRECVTQMREAYQAQIDIEQNKLMKVFTVVTSIFLPLSLIAGWYGMNLQMPEFHWRYGYAMVVGLCLMVCAVWAIIYWKKWR